MINMIFSNIVRFKKMTLTEKLTIRQIYNRDKDYLWSNSPFYPNNLKSFEKWFNKYLRMIEKFDNMSNKEYNNYMGIK